MLLLGFIFNCWHHSSSFQISNTGGVTVHVADHEACFIQDAHLNISIIQVIVITLLVNTHGVTVHATYD